MRTKTLAQWKIPYTVSAEPMPGLVTGLGGVAVCSRAFRGMQLPGACEANLGLLRGIAAGYPSGQIVETAVVGVMLGADCVEDLDRLREDPAVEKLLGYKPPSARTVRDWLEKCHDPAAVQRARVAAAELDLKASVPELSPGLQGLQRVVGVSAREAAQRQAAGTPTVATVDLDATVVASHKQSAYWAYTGVKGYQPEVAVWAETQTVLATEFRDGNVPADKDPLACAKVAFAQLPATVKRYGFRGDSACDNGALLAWLDEEQREGGPAGRIDYAISARMVEALVTAAHAVDESAWHSLATEADGTCRQWAELDYVPALASEKKQARPRRYLGLRLLKPQGELFNDGHDRKHFAIVTNRTERGSQVIEWHREKAGTVEHAHDELKNALAAGHLPSQKFGANAAWFAIQALAFNVLSALRAAAPDPELSSARIKRLRYRLLLVGARLTRFSRTITLRFAAPRAWVTMMRRLLAAFPCRVQPTG
ncbi:MAG: IS1380 family transposase [Acidobacteriota bacterium]